MTVAEIVWYTVGKDLPVFFTNSKSAQIILGSHGKQSHKGSFLRILSA